MRIVYPRTENFWINNGAIAFFEFLKEKSDSSGYDVNYKGCNFKLRSDSLLIEGKRGTIRAIFDEIKYEFLNEVTRKTGKTGWYYSETRGDIKEYEKSDLKLFLKPFLGQLPQKASSKWYVNEVPINVKRLIERKKLKLYGIERKYVPRTQMRLIIKDLEEFNVEDLEEGEEECEFCGRKVKKVSNVKKQNFPFLVELSKHRSFYSFGMQNIEMCDLCKLFSFLAYKKLFFNVFRRESYTYFVPHDPDLRELWHYHNVVGGGFVETELCNFELRGAPNVEFLHENLFRLIFSIYTLHKNFVDEEREKGIDITKTWYCFGISKSFMGGKKAVFTHFDEYNDYSKIIRVLSEMVGKNSAMPGILLRTFSSKKDNTLREKLFERILHFKHPWGEIEKFLSEQIAEKDSQKFPFLYQFIDIIGKEIGMEERILKMCEGIGNAVGEFCFEANKKTLLYDLRNATSIEEFLFKLNQIQFQTEGIIIPSSLLTEMDRRNWDLYKSLISICAMNTYIGRRRSKST